MFSGGSVQVRCSLLEVWECVQVTCSGVWRRKGIRVVGMFLSNRISSFIVFN